MKVVHTPEATLDLATREVEYSPSSTIGGNYAPLLERYRRESEQALAQLPVRRDLRYGAAERAVLDYFTAPASAARPGLLVFIHGGYWQELSKNESAFLAPAWHAAGFAHAVIGYTLAPAASVPEIVSECVQALAWLERSAGTLGHDPDNVVVAGSSAGAYLAAACAARLSAQHSGRVSAEHVAQVLPAPRPAAPRAIVPISGIYDVSPLIGTSINDALRLDAATAALSNLLDHTLVFRPAVVAWGEIETSEFKRQSRAFARLLEDAGTPCETLEIASRNHFDVVHELGDPRSELFQAARRLFRS